MNKYEVSLYVDGLAVINVEADDESKAREIAEYKFLESLDREKIFFSYDFTECADIVELKE